MLEIVACLEIGSCLRSEAIYGDLTQYRDLTQYKDGWRWVQRESNKSENGERERGRAYIVVVERNNKKKNEKNEYFIEISCKINKLM